MELARKEGAGMSLAWLKKGEAHQLFLMEGSFLYLNREGFIKAVAK